MKHAYLLLVLTQFILFACGEDEIQPFVGTWQLSELATSDCPLVGGNLSLELDDDGCTDTGILTICLNQLVAFSADGIVTGSIDTDFGGLEDLGFGIEDFGFGLDDLFQEFELDGTYMNIEDPNNPNGDIIRICDNNQDCRDINYTLVGDQLILENFVLDGNDCSFRLVYTMR